jgi:hypothetical protein
LLAETEPEDFMGRGQWPKFFFIRANRLSFYFLTLYF